ncbi:MAG TPA: hypothetical protein VMT35_04800, partial [Ignavibacteriaceae bacterium]|nr:hypothetical protein [Ignavibacteriaceae bacterium]
RSFALGESFEIILAGEKESADTKLMLKEISSRFIPNKIILLNEKKENEDISGMIPFLQDYIQIDNAATVYLCKNYVCNLPVNNLDDFKKILI